MANYKGHRQRVKIGMGTDGLPEYKWACGATLDELNDSIVRLYVQHGRIDAFLQERESPPVNDGVLFSTYAQQWLERYKESSLKPTTLLGYKSYLRKHLLPAFGDMNLLEISADDIQDFMNAHKDNSKKTIREWLTLLRQILDAAMEDKIIHSNPAKSKRLKNPSDKVTLRDALPLDIFLGIVRQIVNLEVSDRRLMALLMFTGMRRGEALGLQWEDIDFDRMLVSVKRNVTFPSNQPIVTTPKTVNGIRQIPLDPFLVELLDKPKGATGYIIGGQEPISMMSYRNTYIRIERQVDLHGATAHIFRHSYLTLLDEAGVDSKTLQLIAGHGDIKITMNRYVHGRQKEILNAGQKFAALVAGADAVLEIDGKAG